MAHEYKEIENRIRRSEIYFNWVERNKGQCCCNPDCQSEEYLVVHHQTYLYYLIHTRWKIYRKIEPVVQCILDLHSKDILYTLTFCKKCHEEFHNDKLFFKDKPIDKKNIRTDEWVVFPRKLPGEFMHGTKNQSEYGLHLASAQILAGMGWLILAGELDSRMLVFQRVRMARIIGKQPCTSFNRFLEHGLDSLQKLGVVNGWTIVSSKVEVHLSSEYLNHLCDNPWFIGIKDIRTSSLSVFAVRWLLCLQSNRNFYNIGLKKLAGKLNMRTTTPSAVKQVAQKAEKETPWIRKVRFQNNNVMFIMRKKGAIPIWDLRIAARDSINRS